MPKTKELTAKENAAVEYYCSPTSDTRNNWCRSYLSAGYSHCKGWKTNALRILAKGYIKTAIKAMRNNIGEKIAVSREYCIDKLYNIVEQSNNERNVISAITVIGDFAGYKRESAPNQEREQARRDIIAKEKNALDRIQQLAQKRTSE